MTQPLPSPAAELRAAAEMLRKRATDATPGPWHRPLDTRYKSHVNAALPEGERGHWIGGVDPDTGERERATVVTVPTWSNGKHSRARGGRDLEFIALMHPGVGAALADWLEALAAMAAAYPEMAHDHDRPACDDYACDVMGRGTALARTLLGVTE